MINYIKSNLLSIKEGVIMHGCNAKGVMGAGVAEQIRKKYPGVFTKYTQDLQQGCSLGCISWYNASDNLLIASAITQYNFGNSAKTGVVYADYDAIKNCFKLAIENITASNSFYSTNYSLNFPKIGAGLAGGNWEIIEQLILESDPKNKVVKNCFIL